MGGGRMSDYNHKCLVHECKNRMWGGEFVGSLCKPCYLMIATGNDLPSTNFISKLFRERNQLREALECLVDWNPKVEYWERDETGWRFEADMAKARKVLEETE
jgi:hypothetical protein